MDVKWKGKGKEKGKVYLIGAGPGAADLITLRGRRALQSAQVILSDYLLPTNFLEEVGVPRAGKEIVQLEENGRAAQEKINELLLRRAAEGKIVARLKNGDPLIFGRGNEEAQYLTAQGIPWEVIPGISSGVAGPASAGLSLTWRGTGRSFAVVTARNAGGATQEAYPRADSLVIYMGASVLGEIAERLIGEGWPGATSAVLVERASQPWERHAHGTLADLSRVAEEAHIQAPALLIVGAAASPEQRFHDGPRILFTGLDPTNFRASGRLLHWPALEVVREEAGYQALPGIVAQLRAREFGWMIFTSKVGVASFVEALSERHLDGRALSGARIAAAGAGTASALREAGLIPDAVPNEGGSRGILEVVGDARGQNILLVQGTHAPEGLEAALQRRGARVTRLGLHRVQPHPELGRPLPKHDVAYFVSPSGVNAYWEKYGPEAFRKELWAIGEITLAAIAKLGFSGKVVDPHEGRN